MRLQKYLALCGVASRRKAEVLIDERRVKVDGVIIDKQGIQIDDSNVVEVNGIRIYPEQRKIYIMLNKPAGYVVTSKDQFKRPTVLDLIKGIPERLYPVGRLDYETEGLLLLTNDGELANHLTHPKHNVQKTYEAYVHGKFDSNIEKIFESGVEIDGRQTRPAKIELINAEIGKMLCKVVISEGRNRQVRRLFEEANIEVISLRRVSIGKLELGSMKLGNWRELNLDEVNYLKGL